MATSEVVVESDENQLTKRQTAVMMLSVWVVALCGIAYELIIASVSTYLLGNSIAQFSITIGLFMFAMGLGSFVSKWFSKDLETVFILVEVIVALVGGFSSSLLFLVFPFVDLYRPVMYALIIVIGTLVGLEIPLLTRILSRSASWKEAIANVLSLDYLGALVGSVSFPLLLLPSLGLFRSSFAIGFLNVVVALITILTFGPHLKRRWLCRLTAGFIFVCLLTGLLASESMTRFAEGKLYADNIIFRKQTPYQRIIVTRSDRNNEVRLYLDKHLQFASKDEYRYHEALVHPVMSAPGPRRRVLVLGGGDGIALREIFKYEEVEHVTLVDIDPAMTELSRKLEPIRKLNQDSFEDPRVQVVHTDAFKYVLDYAGFDRTEHPAYDRVIVDLPDPHNEVLDKLYSKEFYQVLRRAMSPDGVMVVQSSSPFYTRDVYWCIGRTIEAAEFSVRSYHIALNSFGIWGFHLGSASGQPIETIEIDRTPNRFMTTEVFASAQIFGQDIEPIDVPVNRTFEPKLYPMYLRSMRN